MAQKIREDDEISLIDIIKVLYHYRLFIFISVFLITILSTSVVFYINKKSMFHVRSSWKTASFNSVAVVDQRDLENYIFSDDVFQEIKKSLGDKTLDNFLGEKLEKDSLFRRWKNHIQLTGTDLITKSYNIPIASTINLLLLNKLIQYQNKTLEKKIQDYYQQLKEMSRYLKNTEVKVNISPISYNNASVILKPDAKLGYKDTISIKKVGLISFFLSLFLSIFLVFMIDYIKKMDWDQIKKFK